MTRSIPNPMHINKPDIALSLIGLGTWAIGEEGVKSSVPPEKNINAIDTILKAMEEGVNWIDTAPSYGQGYAEKIVGHALRRLSKKPIIATKCGLVWKNSKIINCLEEKSIRSELEASRKRLKVDVIDIYIIHQPVPDAKIERAWEVLVRLVKEKKVRYIGVSNFSLKQLLRINLIRPPDFMQLHYSLLFRSAGKYLLPYCAKNKISVMAYSPIERGLLTGKFSQRSFNDLPADDHRRKNKIFQVEQNFQTAEQLRSLATKYNISMAQLAIAWVLRRQEITSVLVGASTPRQIKETAAAASLMLGKEKWDYISKQLKRRAV